MKNVFDSFPVHGGDTEYFEKNNIIIKADHSASINPLGIPTNVRKAILNCIEQINQYPDPGCSALKRAISEALSTDAGSIVCGNGAADLIYRIIRSVSNSRKADYGKDGPLKALVIAPCFSEYEKALYEEGIEIEYYFLKEKNGFELTEEVCKIIDDTVDMVILGQPGNPTGRLISPSVMDSILGVCSGKNVTIIADECFIDFIGGSEQKSHSFLKYDYRGIIIIRSFTKMYSIPGIRLGYAVFGDKREAAETENTGQAWPVSSIAMEAGIAALSETDYAETSRSYIEKERERILPKLSDNKNVLKVVSTCTNFVLFRHKDLKLFEKMAKKGILIRDCSNFKGLSKGWYRIAIKTAKDNDRLLELL